jgi:hypothetical protein
MSYDSLSMQPPNSITSKLSEEDLVGDTVEFGGVFGAVVDVVEGGSCRGWRWEACRCWWW